MFAMQLTGHKTRSVFDRYNTRWSLSDWLQLLAFEAELAHLPRSLIAAIWEALEYLDSDRIETGKLGP